MMTEPGASQKDPTPSPTIKKLLNAEERAACEQVARGESSHKGHAIALLAIDEGATYAQAAEKSGLNTGQVKYWLGKFRTERMAIFGEAATPQTLAVEMPPVKGEVTKKKKDKSRSEKKEKQKKKDKKNKKKKNKDKAGKSKKKSKKGV